MSRFFLKYGQSAVSCLPSHASQHSGMPPLALLLFALLLLLLLAALPPLPPPLELAAAMPPLPPTLRSRLGAACVTMRLLVTYALSSSSSVSSWSLLYPRCLPIAPLLLALLLLLLLPNIMRKSEKELERGRGASNDELCPGYF